HTRFSRDWSSDVCSSDLYGTPADRSTLEIFENYRQALTAAGVELLYTCALDECGPAWGRSAWGRYNGLFVAADGDPRYLSGRLESGRAPCRDSVRVSVGV